MVQALGGRPHADGTYSGRSSAVKTINNINLPGDSSGDVPITADLYYPRSSQRAAPLVIVMPGAFGVKSLFTNAGHDLAGAGFAALVIEQLRPVLDPFVQQAIVRLAQLNRATGSAPALCIQNWPCGSRASGTCAHAVTLDTRLIRNPSVPPK